MTLYEFKLFDKHPHTKAMKLTEKEVLINYLKFSSMKNILDIWIGLPETSSKRKKKNKWKNKIVVWYSMRSLLNLRRIWIKKLNQKIYDIMNILNQEQTISLDDD